MERNKIWPNFYVKTVKLKGQEWKLSWLSASLFLSTSKKFECRIRTAMKRVRESGTRVPVCGTGYQIFGIDSVASATLSSLLTLSIFSNKFLFLLSSIDMVFLPAIYYLERQFLSTPIETNRKNFRSIPINRFLHRITKVHDVWSSEDQ